MAARSGERRWPDGNKGDWNLVQKSEWLRRELLKVGANVWLGCMGYGDDGGRQSDGRARRPDGRARADRGAGPANEKEKRK